MQNVFILTATIILNLNCAPAAHAQRTRDDILKLGMRPAFFELQWTYKNFPLKMRVFETDAKESDLFKMGTVRQLSDLKLKAEVQAPIRIAHDAEKMLVLVMENTTKSPIRFAASPHSVDPVVDSLGFRFKCLCFGHTYNIPPGEIWYRYVKLEAMAAQAGKRVKVVHHVFKVEDASPAKNKD